MVYCTCFLAWAKLTGTNALVDAGKSTMLGVLTKNTLDDGRGRTRVNLFRHKHEIESGRTSSVGMKLETNWYNCTFLIIW